MKTGNNESIIDKFVEQAERHYEAGKFLQCKMYLQEAAFLFHLSSEKYVKAVAIQGGNREADISIHEISEICKKISNLPEKLIDGIRKPANIFPKHFSVNIRYNISSVSIQEISQQIQSASWEIAINAMRALEFYKDSNNTKNRSDT